MEKKLRQTKPGGEAGSMQRFLAMAVMCLALPVFGFAADEVFSKAVRSEEFAAAGLGKLSVEELARLDGLVRDYKSGTLEAARKEIAAAEARAAKAEAVAKERAAEAEARAVRAEAVAKERAAAAEVAAKKAEKAESASLLARAKVLLTPGTEIEYSTVESRIAGDFRGYQNKSVLVLENGQRWRVASAESYDTPVVRSPAVKVVPGVLGAFWMTIEGVKPRVKVEIVSRGL